MTVTLTTTAERLRLEFVKCRTWGHAWDLFPSAWATRRTVIFTWQDAFRCTRCSTEKYESYNLKGEVAQRQYVYPDGYKLAEKLTRAQFRLELRSRNKLTRRKRA